MKITLSKAQWENIGLKAGWIKTHTTYSKNWYSLYLEANRKEAHYIPVQEFEKRLRQLGWDLSKKEESDYMAFAPPQAISQHYDDQGKATKLTIPVNNWDRRWREVRKDLERMLPTLNFAFDPKFIIPENFNLETQSIPKIDTTPKYKESVKTNMFSVPWEKAKDKKCQIEINGKWENIIDVDYEHLQVMLEDGNVVTLIPNYIKIREQI